MKLRPVSMTFLSPKSGTLVTPTPAPASARPPSWMSSDSAGSGSSSTRSTSATSSAAAAAAPPPPSRPSFAGPPKRSEERVAFLAAFAELSSGPEFLRPLHTPESGTILFDSDGELLGGTLVALVEYLTIKEFSSNRGIFQAQFLSTYRSFSSGGVIVQLLVDRYSMQQPPSLTDDEVKVWTLKKLRPTQIRGLEAIKAWIEDHRLILEEPSIVIRLLDFLSTVKSPSSNVQLAQTLLQTLQGQTSNPLSLYRQPTSIPPRKRRLSKQQKEELIQVDATEVAQHLTLLEARLYSKIMPSDCINWARTQEQSENLKALSQMGDSLTKCVKWSVLSLDRLGKRADMIDHWIRIGEACRNMNNISTMFAVVAGLCSTDINRMSVTWLHVDRHSHLRPLSLLSDASGNFSNYRELTQTLASPCLPYMPIHLAELVQIHSQLPDMLSDTGPPLINFTKRRRLWEALDNMLRFQDRPYANLVENPATSELIQKSLVKASSIDSKVFRSKSKELAAVEIEESDVKKGLHAAGF